MDFRSERLCRLQFASDVLLRSTSNEFVSPASLLGNERREQLAARDATHLESAEHSQSLSNQLREGREE